MGGVAAQQRPECRELGAQLDLAKQLVGLQMKADGERWQQPGKLHRLTGRRPQHHQARAGDDAPPVRLLDARVHSVRHAEVVGIDDQADG
jgi:hypothetical protein